MWFLKSRRVTGLSTWLSATLGTNIGRATEAKRPAAGAARHLQDQCHGGLPSPRATEAASRGLIVNENRPGQFVNDFGSHRDDVTRLLVPEPLPEILDLGLNLSAISEAGTC